MSDAALRDEVVELARALIRVDTSNPPGRETAAAEVLADYLRAAGIEPELVGPDPDRLNLVARLEGAGGPSLMLLAHTDVVPAPPSGWSVGPFEGALRDGRLIGRGATDMKNELAARAVAFAAVARSGRPPPGDLVLVAEADEERNTADVGMSWLVRERPDLRCNFALNEGGGMLLELPGGRQVMTLSVGEKQVTSLRLRVHGRGGHASAPGRAANPLAGAATVIERLIAYRAPGRLLPAAARALEALGAPAANVDEAVAWACALHPVLAAQLPAMTRMTVTPTGLEATEPANVIPGHADVICDCRPLPGQTEDDIREHVERALGTGAPRYDLELLEPVAGGTESPTATPLYEACEHWVERRAPGAGLLPMISTGFTDSHWVRSVWGTVAYGFAPVLATDAEEYLDAAHADDEAIETADLLEMADFHLHAIGAMDTAQKSAG